MTGDKSVVKTYVPESQKQIWEEHADRLDMPTSEFLRTMVQAGRRNIEVTEDDTLDDKIREAVETILVDAGFATYDELVNVLADDIEDSVVAALEALEKDDEIRYNPQRGGYEYIGTEDTNA